MTRCVTFYVNDNPLFQVDSHNGWIKDIIAYNNLSTGFSYPIIADPKREVATLYGMMDPDEKDAKGIPLTCRS